MLCFLQGQTSDCRMAQLYFSHVCRTKEGSKLGTFLHFRFFVSYISSNTSVSTPSKGKILERECPPALPKPHLPSTTRDPSTTLQSLCSITTYQLKAEIQLPPDLHICAWQDSDEPAVYHVTRWATFCFHVPYSCFSLCNTQSICLFHVLETVYFVFFHL